MDEFKQPLPLILQTFQDLTDKNEDFWHRACPFFKRKEFVAGTTLYKRGDQPDVAQELLRISLKLTSERLSAITSSVALPIQPQPWLTR